MWGAPGSVRAERCLSGYSAVVAAGSGPIGTFVAAVVAGH